MNESKTAILPIGWGLTSEKLPPAARTSKVLGVAFNRFWNFADHIELRIKECRTSLAKFTRVFKTNKITCQMTRVNIVRHVIRPKLFYGAEVWAKHLTDVQAKSLRKFERGCMIKMSGVYSSTSYDILYAVFNMPILFGED